MIRQAVSSSNLSAVGYDADGSILEIEFKDGSVYQYFSVPESIFTGLIAASSAGKYFHLKIKDVYRYRQVR